ncbi:restriction system-associated AAA family ATPase [compost metagenome]
MNIIETAQVTGFWGTHEVHFTAHDDFNFIIGPNGSGKSTLLQLIAGVLQADKTTLSKLDFDRVKITLRNPKTRKKPTIEAERVKESPYFQVQYSIFESASEKPYKYELSDLEYLEPFGSWKIRLKITGKSIKTLRQHLEELVSLTWLSVQRSGHPQEASHFDPLDQKLEDLSNRLVRYLSSIGKQVNRLHEKFQEQVFLSMFTTNRSELRKIPSQREIEKEKHALIQIFSQFQIDKKNYSEKIEEHFSALEGIQEKIKSKQQLSEKEFQAILDLNRIEKSVEFWEKITEEKGSLLSPRDKFLELLNNLMQRKSLSINERNEITIKTQSGKSLTLRQLSSGEKQILIILGEALLQEGQSYMYIADEPELSLHVSWQESLAQNLKALNPSAQIIFATHSPDIVGPYLEKIIDMEACIK